MKILACDTASLTASVALVEEGMVLTEFAIHNRKTHSQKLLPMISSLLSEMGVKPQDVDAFAVSEGPGSFTGLRIGLVTMKAMAYALEKPVVGVPTLEALAYTIPFFSGVVCPVMDARNDQAFCGFYQRDQEKITRLDDDDVLHVESLANKLCQYKQNILFVGDCSKKFQQMVHSIWLASNEPKFVVAASSFLFTTRAATIGLLADTRIKNGEFGDPFLLRPNYMRASQAEQYKQRKDISI